MALAGIGVILFSATFPATTVALRGFDAVFVGAGRSVGAAVLAGLTLWLTRSPLPTRRQFKVLLACVPGVGIGYGVLTAVALEHVTASHAAVVTGLLPVATAAAATWRAGERPGRLFWVASVIGACAVVAFALSSNVGSVHAADALLLVALILGAIGYAEGGRLAREMPGWRVICWVVVLALPLSLPLTVMSGIITPPHPDFESDLALLYLASVTMSSASSPGTAGSRAPGSRERMSSSLRSRFSRSASPRSSWVNVPRPSRTSLQLSCWRASWPLSARGSGAIGCDRRRLGCH